MKVCHAVAGQTEAMRVREIFERAGIEAYIGFGGIHLHIKDEQMKKAEEIASKNNLIIEDGLLPEADKIFKRASALL